jgi:hypothetical protein
MRGSTFCNIETFRNCILQFISRLAVLDLVYTSFRALIVPSLGCSLVGLRRIGLSGEPANPGALLRPSGNGILH